MDMNNSMKVSVQRLKNLEVLRLYLKRSQMALKDGSQYRALSAQFWNLISGPRGVKDRAYLTADLI